MSVLVILLILLTNNPSLVQSIRAFPKRVATEYDALSFQPFDALVKGDVPFDPLKLGQRSHFKKQRKEKGRTLNDNHGDAIARNQVRSPRQAAMEQSQKRNGKKGRRAQPQPEAIAKNQVRNPRLAAQKFEHKPAKRAAASPLPCSGQAANYGQCGGISYTGPSCCSLGWTCQYSNDYYSQCVPAPTTCSNAFGGQCGGLSWTGDTCCPIGSACVYSNDYYSQCIVGATPTTSTSTAASTTATSTTQIIPTTSLTTSTTMQSTTSSTATSTSAPTTSSIPTSTSTTKTSTTSLTTTSTSTSASPSATCNLPVIGAYGQCGGTGFTGLSCCVAGYTCIVSNDYYAQCVPSPLTISSTQTTSATTSSTTTAMPTSLTTSTAKPPTTSSTATSTSVPTTSTVVTSTSTTKTSTTSLTTTSTSTSASPSATCNLPVIGAYGQCGGTGFTGLSCCVAGYTCVVSNDYYAQCVPTPLTTTSTSTSATSTTASPTTTSTTTTSTTSRPTSTTLTTISTSSLSSSSTVKTSTALTSTTSIKTSTTLTTTSTIKTSTTTTTSSALPTSTCIAGGGGSDGCTPYSVSGLGLTLPLLVTFPSGGHVNYQAIACSQYTPGETYLRPGSDWTSVSFGMQFDPNIGQPGAVYIGKSFFDWGQASAYFGLGGFCVTWVQSSQYNQHFGEGGQAPVCSLTCLK